MWPTERPTTHELQGKPRAKRGQAERGILHTCRRWRTPCVRLYALHGFPSWDQPRPGRCLQQNLGCRHLHKQILIKDLHTHCLAGDNGWQLGGERDGRPERYVTHVLRGPQTIPDSGRDVQEKERQTDRQTDRESRKRRCDFEFFSCACPPDTRHPGGDTNVLSERYCDGTYTRRR